MLVTLSICDLYYKDFLIIYQAAHKLPYHNLIIMVTYYVAQYCITNWSMAKHIRIQNTTAQGSKIINNDLLKNINMTKLALWKRL